MPCPSPLTNRPRAGLSVVREGLCRDQEGSGACVKTPRQAPRAEGTSERGTERKKKAGLTLMRLARQRGCGQFLELRQIAGAQLVVRCLGVGIDLLGLHRTGD